MTASFKTAPTSGKAGGAPLAFTFSSGAFTYVYWDVTLTLSIGTLYSASITLNPANQALFSIPASWSSAIPNSTSGTLTATLKSVPKPGSGETSTVTRKRTIAVQVADDASTLLLGSLSRAYNATSAAQPGRSYQGPYGYVIE